MEAFPVESKMEAFWGGGEDGGNSTFGGNRTGHVSMGAPKL